MIKKFRHLIPCPVKMIIFAKIYGKILIMKKNAKYKQYTNLDLMHCIFLLNLIDGRGNFRYTK